MMTYTAQYMYNAVKVPWLKYEAQYRAGLSHRSQDFEGNVFGSSTSLLGQ